MHKKAEHKPRLIIDVGKLHEREQTILSSKKKSKKDPAWTGKVTTRVVKHKYIFNFETA